ncbi:peptidoglycan-binding domain-containing protein [Loktanella sp. Alg231-35]|uniref:peptidoglycan-binding domain-containing protein n=1 Tax=Loktanella sp. Alg231-35 TaxID=1922220 RepID=UPI000D54DB47|nr:peptidoglycan-binding domain-containing protein [Loktanella sp. Alg231-35]
MRKLTLIAALSALAMPAMADDAALLMGVSRYDEFRRVSNGLDVLNSAESLRDAGYTVGTLANGSADAMERLLARFANQAAGAERLVVGLAGRFVTDGTRSWLLAEDADRPTPFGLDDAVSVEMIMNVMAQAPGQSVLILGYNQGDDDAIGSYLRQGIGALDVPQGVTVLLADPSSTDGVVMDALTEPGGDVMAFVRDSRRVRAVGYVPRTLVMEPEFTETARPLPTIDPSLRAWNDAQEANAADAYREFIFDHPRSEYAAEARRRLDEIESDPIRMAEIEEDGLNLTRNERRAIQRNLTLLEFSTRGVDGIFGPGSRGAIRNWQQSNGFAQTSYLTTEQINRIDAQASRRAAEIEAEEERAREEALRLDRDYWEETGARGSEAGYRAYLDRYPEGIFANEARQKLGALDTSNNEEARERERALGVNPVLRRLIESRLAQLGYNPGQVDGRFDRDTRGAIGRYQSRYNLPATGYLDQGTLARLLADTIGR